MECSIDTGSSDLWVYATGSGENLSYTPSDSSTYRYVNSDFSITYVKGQATGDWVEDTITFVGNAVKGQQFATVNDYQSDSKMGIPCIGYVADESTSSEYSNFPATLVSQEFINREAYSLYLDDLDASSGILLFGGVNFSKYTGTLYTVPVTSSHDLQVSATYESATFSAILDSGSSLLYAPNSVVKSIASNVGATYNSQFGAYFLDSLPSETTTFSFSGVSIDIPGSQIVVRSDDILSDPSSAPAQYMLGVLPNTQSQGINLFGDVFLRNAYVVYDLANNEISLAQANYNSGSSNVQEIPADGPIPGAEPAPYA